MEGIMTGVYADVDLPHVQFTGAACMSGGDMGLWGIMPTNGHGVSSRIRTAYR